MARGWLLLVVLGCSAPPQQANETALTYRAVFRAEPGVTAKVTFPWVNDSSALEVQQNLSITDGGTFSIEETPQGLGLSISGRGTVTAEYVNARSSSVPGGNGVPQTALTMQLADAGTEARYLRVNKGGTAVLAVEFEYSAVRNCGDTCGGSRSWQFQDTVGLAVQEVSMQFSETKR